MNDAVALFGNKDAAVIVLLKPFREYLDSYAEKVTLLMQQYQSGELIVGEENQVEFVKLYGEILKLRNILTSFDDLENDEILSDRVTQEDTLTIQNKPCPHHYVEQDVSRG